MYSVSVSHLIEYLIGRKKTRYIYIRVRAPLDALSSALISKDATENSTPKCICGVRPPTVDMEEML